MQREVKSPGHFPITLTWEYHFSISPFCPTCFSLQSNADTILSNPSCFNISAHTKQIDTVLFNKSPFDDHHVIKNAAAIVKHV